MTPIISALSAVIPIALLLSGLALSVISNTYVSKQNKKLMLAVLLLTAVLVAQNGADYFLHHSDAGSLPRIIVSSIGYTVRPAIIVLFCSIIDGSRKHIPLWVLTGINAAIYLTNFFTKLVFTYYDDVFIRGPLGYTCHITSGFLVICLSYLIFKKYKNSIRELTLPIASTVLVVIAVALDTFLPFTDEMPVSALTSAIILSCNFYYYWLHMQFVRQHEEDLKAEQRIKIMVSQIQPHFLYNTIATIRALCRSNPERAEQVTEKFGRYLRRNLDSLNNSDLIPVEKEISHTKVYADIEMVRFENIRVEFDIQDKDFSVPALTVQPLVENAIRHGVRIREEGIVCVKTYFENNCHIIEVSDNGIGFDADNINNNDGSHIGLENVRNRIEMLCGGSLTIKSRKNAGTTVIISIPKTEKTR